MVDAGAPVYVYGSGPRSVALPGGDIDIGVLTPFAPQTFLAALQHTMYLTAAGQEATKEAAADRACAASPAFLRAPFLPQQ